MGGGVLDLSEVLCGLGVLAKWKNYADKLRIKFVPEEISVKMLPSFCVEAAIVLWDTERGLKKEPEFTIFFHEKTVASKEEGFFDTLAHETAHVYTALKRMSLKHDFYWSAIFQAMGGSGKVYHELFQSECIGTCSNCKRKVYVPKGHVTQYHFLFRGEESKFCGNVIPLLQIPENL